MGNEQKPTEAVDHSFIKLSACSVMSNSHMVLPEILRPNTSLAIWQRESSWRIEQYFRDNFATLGINIRGVFALDNLKTELLQILPEHEYRDEVVEDILLLSDLITCLFNCDSVGLRLAPLQKAMCPKFHVDNIPVRLVNTYLGPGTEWLPVDAPSEESLHQMDPFSVGLLKGKAWEGHEDMAARHRSCQVEANSQRVLLTLDPL